jgi:hypothetical protein
MVSAKEYDRLIKGGQSNIKDAKKLSKDNKETNSTPEKQMPKWLMYDILTFIGGHEYDKIEYELFNTYKPAKYLFGHFGTKFKKDFHEGVPHREKNVRGIITKTGKIIYAEANDYVHSHVVSYCMLIGEIPQLQKYSHYVWGENTASSKDFIAFEQENREIILSQSYDSKPGAELVSLILQSKGIFKKYNSIFKNKFNMSSEEIQEI